MATSQRSWELSGNTLTYKIDGATVATIGGVSNTIAISKDADGIGSITDGSVEVYTDTDGKLTFKLYSSAFTGKNVTLTQKAKNTYPCKLELGNDVSGVSIDTSTAVMSSDVTKGTATVKANLTEGYALTSETKITYTAAKKSQTIATVSGLLKDTKKTTFANGTYGTAAEDDDGNTVYVYDDDESAIYFDQANNKITLRGYNEDTGKSTVLGTTNVTITNSNGASYTLDFDRSKVYDDADTQVTNGIIGWDVSSTAKASTATYKKYTPAYYSYDESKNAIVYHKQADVATYAVVKGLAGNLAVNDTNSNAIVNSDDITVVSLNTDTKVITLTGGTDTDDNNKIVYTGALTNGSVTFDTKKTESTYTLALAADYSPALSDTPNYAWSASGKTTKTATLKGALTEGWKVASTGKSITYSKATTATTLATISGLDKSVVAKKVDGVSSLGVDVKEGTTTTFNAGATIGEADSETGKTAITLNDYALGSSNVLIAGDYGYILAVDGVDNAASAKAASRENDNWIWSFDKTTGTATYSQYTPEYYTLDANGNSIAYTEGAATKTLATVTGLATNLTVSDDGKSLGAYVKKYNEETKKNETVWEDYVTISEGTSGVITLSKEALADQDIEVDSATGYSYTLALDEEDADEITEPADFLQFSFEGTTAKLRSGKIKGYKLSTNGKALTFTAGDEGTIVATVTGLKSGLKVSDLEKTEDAEGNVLYTNHIGVTATGTATDDDDKEYTYTYVTKGLTVGTVTNTPKSNKVEAPENPALILTSDVLDNRDVTVSGTGDYQLTLADEEGNQISADETTKKTVLSPARETTTAWKTNGSTAILVPYTAESWTEVINTDNKKSTINNVSVSDAVFSIKYAAAVKGETIATLTGLNSKALTLDNSTGQIDGIDASGVTAETNEETGKVTYSGGIKLSNKVLNKTDVIITPEDTDKMTASITLGLSEDVTLTSSVDTTGSGLNETSHVYTYEEKVASTGYDAGEDAGGNIIYRKAGTTKTTISNLTEDPYFADGVFTINSDGIVEGKNAVISSKNNYTLALADPDNISSTYAFSKAKNATKATYNRVDSGYTLAANAKSINYSNEAKPTAVATISGLKKDVEIDPETGKIIKTTTTTDEETGETTTTTTIVGDGITVGTNANGEPILTLDRAILGANNVTLGKNDNYSLAINATDCAPDTVSPTLTLSSSGTATIKEGTSEGWTLTAPKTITYTKEKLSTVATISGLPKTSTISDSNVDYSTGVITLGKDELDGAKKITLKDGTSKSYTLTINKTSDVVPTEYENPKWTFSNGKAVLKDGTSGGWLVTNSKTLTYQTAKLTNVATVTGLPKNLAVWNGELYIAATDEKGKIIYQTDEDGNFLYDDDGNKIPELAEGSSEPVLTFTEATYDSNGNLRKAGTINVSKALLDVESDILVKETSKGAGDAVKGVKKLTIGTKDDYVFAFDTEDSPDSPGAGDTPNYTATKTANGTVEYTVDMSAGYVFSNGDKTLTYSPEGTTTLAKITGLSSTNLKKASGAEADNTVDVSSESNLIVIDNTKKTITLKEDALAGVTKTVKLTSDDYSLVVDSGLEPTVLSSPTWSVSGTKATLREGTTAGYTASEDGKTVTYTAATADDTIAIITGLKKGNKVVDGKIDGISVYPSLKTIAVSSKVLGTTDVSLDAESEYSFDTEDLPTPAPDEPQWTVSKGTATLKQNVTAGFTPSNNNKLLTYTPAKSNATLVTVTGLNPSYDYTVNQSALTWDESTNTILLGADALTNKKVAIKEKNSGYTLELGDDVPLAAEAVTEWVTSGTTATYKEYTPAYYKKNLTTGAIDYTAESKPAHTYVTISGLKKGATISSSDVKNKVITLKDSQLGTSTVTLKDGEDKDYTLRLSSSVTKTEQSGAVWTNSKGTATLKGTLTAGYTLAANGKSITYLSKDKTNQTFATVTGLKNDATVVPEADEDGVITLSYDQLNGKAVKLTNSNGSTYTLALDNEVTESKVTEIMPTATVTDEETEETEVTSTWAVKNGTATLKGAVSEGYKLTDSNNIAYTKETTYKTVDEEKVYTYQTLVTVSGVASGAKLDIVDEDDTTINLKSNQLTSKVTVSDTKGYYDYNFASDYTNSTIVGSTGADSITVEGTGLTLNTGKGNDYVDFANSGNTFVYATGEGNDVIADFTVNSDRVKITSGKSITLTNDGDDTVIKVDKGTITLKDQTLSSFVYYDKNDNPVALSAVADLMESDNFMTAEDDLGAITGTGDLLGDLADTQAFPNSDLTTLTKQSTLVTYGNDKK